MAYKIDKDICIRCGTCMAVCPIAAVDFKDGDYEIDPEKCKDCGVCAENCPVSCISKGS